MVYAAPRAIALKAVSFAMIGVINTAVDFCVFWTAATYLHWPVVPANVLAWIVAVTLSYAMNSFITFGARIGTAFCAGAIMRVSLHQGSLA